MKALAMLWRHNRWLVLAFAATLAVTGFFAVRFVLGWMHWHDPQMRDQPIAGWMTPRYVAMSWHVPREVMLEALGMVEGPPNGGKPESIDAIAAESGLSTEALIAEIEAAIANYRTSTQPASQ